MKKVVLALTIVGLLGTGAQAGIQLNGWRIDLDAAFGTVAGTWGTISGIDEIEFLGITHSSLRNVVVGPFEPFTIPPYPVGGLPSINSIPNAAFPDPGDFYDADGLLRATSMDGGGLPKIVSTAGKILNIDFEMTFDFSVTSAVVPPPFGPPGNTTVHTTHLAGADPNSMRDGVLEWYIDDLTDMVGAQANTHMTLGGAGFQDGVLIATFDVVAGDGGVVNPTTMDGSDDGTFDMDHLLTMVGVLWADDGMGGWDDIQGIDALPNYDILAITDSNYDMDPDNNGIIDSGPPAFWPHAGGPGGNLANPYVREDGSATLEVIPEPASIAVWGLLLAAACFYYRRKR